MGLEKIEMLNKEGILDLVRKSGIREYSERLYTLSTYWEEHRVANNREGRPVRVIASIDNSDIEGVLLQLLKDEPEKIMEGLVLACKAIDGEEKILQIPAYAPELVDLLKDTADIYGIKLETGIVDMRDVESSVVHHIATMKQLVEVIDGQYEDVIYVQGNDGELTKVQPSMKVSELVNIEGLKAVEVGYDLLLPDELDICLEDARITNGIIRTYSQDSCFVHETQEKMLKYNHQSCGKCVFCREGLIQIYGIAKQSAQGKGHVESLPLIEEIGDAMVDGSLCSVGQRSSLFAVGAVKKFADEFSSHIKKKECQAGVCLSMEVIYIDPIACTGCGDCIDVCPVDCIDGKAGYIHMIDEFDCSKCGKCIDVCEEEAIFKTSGKLPKLPNRLTKVGKFKKKRNR